MSFSPSIRQIFRQAFSDVNDALRVVGITHSKVDKGELFTVGEFFDDVLNGSSAEFLVVAHADFSIHITFGSNSSGSATFSIFENTTTSSLGEELTPSNNNRNSTKTPNAKIYKYPTVSNDGDKLFDVIIPGVEGRDPLFADEFIFKKGLTYLVRSRNTSGGSDDMSLSLGFYET